MKLFAADEGFSNGKRRKKQGANWRKGLALLVALAMATFARADQWATPTNPKHGHKLLGRVVLTIEIRADGTVKRVWPTAASVRTSAAWRAARAAKELTFPRGAPRKVQLPVTVYLD